MDELLPRLLRQRPPRRVHDRRGGHRARTRPRARKVARFIGAPRDRRDRVHQERDRGDQPRRLHVGPRQPARGRRRSCSPRWSTTPTSCRGTCSRPSAASSCAGSRIDRRLPARPHRPRPAARRRQARSRVTAMSNVLGTLNDIRPARRRRPRRRRARARRRVPVRAPRSRPTCRPGTPTSSPSPATRCSARRGIGALWARARAARGDAAVPRRRRDDPRRPPRRLHAPTSVPWKFEAGTPPIAEAVGFGAAVDYLDGARHGRGARPRDARSPRYALDALARPLRRRRSRSTARPTPTMRGGVGLVPLRRHPRPRHLARCSTRTACACGPATTAPSR